MYFISKLNNVIALVDIKDFSFIESVCNAFDMQNNVIDYFSDLMAYFSDSTKEKYFINLKIVEELYGAENPLLKYVGLQLWDEYSRILKADKEKDEDYPVRQRLEDLTLPFRYSLINKILDSA